MGEYFHHKALDLGSVSNFLFVCLGMGGKGKCDWQEDSAFMLVSFFVLVLFVIVVVVCLFICCLVCLFVFC